MPSATGANMEPMSRDPRADIQSSRQPNNIATEIVTEAERRCRRPAGTGIANASNEQPGTRFAGKQRLRTTKYKCAFIGYNMAKHIHATKNADAPRPPGTHADKFGQRNLSILTTRNIHP